MTDKAREKTHDTSWYRLILDSPQKPAHEETGRTASAIEIHHTSASRLDPEQSPSYQFVWLHGWGQTHSSLLRLAKLFRTDGPQTLYDLPGFGETALLPPDPQTGEGAGTRDYASTLNCEMAHLPSDRPVILIGHSFGARVAVQMAAHYRDNIAAIILISGAGLKRRRSPFWHIKALCLKALIRLARLIDGLLPTQFLAKLQSKVGSSDYRRAGPLRPTFVKAVNEDLTSEALACKVPTLLIYGSEDTATPPEIGRRYESLIPIARLEVAQGFGHLDILDRGVYQTEGYIRSFLKDISHGHF